MSLELFHQNDQTGAFEATKGSDGRQNVSSRSDDRIYYISRDFSEAYSIVYQDATAAAGTIILNCVNDANDLALVVHSVGFNAIQRTTLELIETTGVPTGGSVITPFCLNRVTVHTAQCTVRGNDALGVVTSSGEFDHAQVEAGGHEEFRIRDSIRIGPGGSFGLNVETTVSAGIVEGVIFIYFEKLKSS